MPLVRLNKTIVKFVQRSDFNLDLTVLWLLVSRNKLRIEIRRIVLVQDLYSKIFIERIMVIGAGIEISRRVTATVEFEIIPTFLSPMAFATGQKAPSRLGRAQAAQTPAKKKV